MKEQIDIFDDLLIEFDEMGFVPTTAVPDHEAYAIDWKNRLINALEGYRKKSEGEWIFEHEFYGKMLCSNCKEEALTNEDNEYVDSDFCPNCGAKMKGEKE